MLREVLRPEDLANLGLALPSRPVFFVKFHEAYRSFDRLLLRLQFKLRIAADNFLGVRELLGRWARFLSVLDQHHESHRHISFFISGCELGILRQSRSNLKPGSISTS